VYAFYLVGNISVVKDYVIVLLSGSSNSKTKRWGEEGAQVLDLFRALTDCERGLKVGADDRINWTVHVCV